MSNRTRASVLIFLIATSLTAQFETATLTGIVSDPAGAVIANGTVKLTSQATNVETTAVTDAEGRYSFSALRPGTYRITTSAPGFKQWISTGVVLQVNQSARIDVQLTVGDVAERIEVMATAPMLETATSARGAVLDQTKIVELPLNGRDYNQLALLSPGVLAPTPRLQGIGFKGAFNVNGNRAFNNAFQLDGVDNTSYSNSFRGLNMQVVQPSVEALQEFKIQTNAYSAEFGRSSGALINAVTRSGSNQLHGSLYEFHRNDNLDAANFFANKQGLEKPFRLRNQFGAAVGGRIVQDKTFFFADYEGLRDGAGVVRLSSVPNPMWRQGIFATPIHNPFNPTDTGQDFRIPATAGCNDGSGNCWRIPENLIDPVGRRIMAVAPDPNTFSSTSDNNYVSVPVNRTETNQFDVRLDHTLASNVNVFGRYSFVDTVFVQPAPRPGLAEGSTNDTFGTADLRSQGIAAGVTWVLTPSIVSETRLGHSRGDYYQFPPNFGSGCPQELIGLRGAPTDEAICGGMPVVSFPGGTLRRLGRTTSVPQQQTPRSWNLRQSLATVKGSHSLRGGGEILFVATGVRDVSSLLGNFDFTGRFTGVNARWENAIADVLLGLPTRYQQDSNTTFDIYQRMYFGYVQDDWKVARSFTINLGMRYEFATPTRERNLQWANYDAATQSFVLAKEGSLRDEALVNPDRNNFAPRV
ncbi:MAG TPA: TonB-dependent receptor, partial [Bryobacteraceae bacterium]|nr:TonB-dependent receptor [Bryobacteraceae bacterium]